MSKFEYILELVLCENVDPKYKSAVAVVKYNDMWLLGLAKNNGERGGKWCHPGGQIKRGEKPEKAAERECYEETGIRCAAIGKPFGLSRYDGIAFVPCRVSGSSSKISVNGEFSAAGFFTMAEIRNLKPLYKNVIDVIEKAKRAKR